VNREIRHSNALYVPEYHTALLILLCIMGKASKGKAASGSEGGGKVQKIKQKDAPAAGGLKGAGISKQQKEQTHKHHEMADESVKSEIDAIFGGVAKKNKQSSGTDAPSLGQQKEEDASELQRVAEEVKKARVSVLDGVSMNGLLQL
jgi:hypothetical protein